MICPYCGRNKLTYYPEICNRNNKGPFRPEFWLCSNCGFRHNSNSNINHESILYYKLILKRRKLIVQRIEDANKDYKENEDIISKASEELIKRVIANEL